MSDPNQFSVVGTLSLDDVEAGLRAAPMLQERDVFPFADADISFEWVKQADVFPTSLIAVKRKLVRQGAISAAMRSSVGYDQYELEGSGVMLAGGPEGTKGVIPPVVVEAEGLDHVKREGILDGLHRAFDCFWVQRRQRLLVARITNAAPDYRAYAYTNAWSAVKLKDEKPHDKRHWKYYVGNPLQDEEYQLYVDFSHLNGSRPYVPGEGKTS